MTKFSGALGGSQCCPILELSSGGSGGAMVVSIVLSGQEATIRDSIPTTGYTIWLFNSLPWKDPPFSIGKPSISMGHLYHGYVK